MKDNPINWDKLLAHLDSQKVGDKGDLSAEELDMLQYAEKVQGKLRSETAEEQFPVKEGWEEFRHKKNGRALRKVLAYAAVLLAFVSIGLWMYTKIPDEAVVAASIVTEASEKNITLRLADGKEVVVGEQAQTLQEGNSRIQATEDIIAYDSNNLESTTAPTARNTLIVPLGLRTKLQLEDGTQVWVNAGTELEYPVTFARGSREVYVRGEAYFDVKHDSNRPFLVHAGGLTVRVLGTDFGVNTFHGSIETALVSGSVELSVNGTVKRISPGEVVSYNTQTAKFTVEGDVRRWVAWKDDMLYFDDMNLSDIVDRLGRTYDYQFIFDDPELKTQRFTMDIRQTKELGTALEYLQLSLQTIDFTINGRVVHIHTKK